MKEIDRRKAGFLYSPYKTGDPSWHNARVLLQKINQEWDWKKTESLFRDLLGAVGEDCSIVTPFQCDLGRNIFLGNHVMINMDFLALDEGEIHIDDHVLIGPRVSIYTPIHPMDPQIRKTDLETCKPVTIEKGVWICGSCVINPGVTIHENSVIGSGSVVTRDIPAGVFAAGNPCRVIRKIDEQDRLNWSGQYEDYQNDPDIQLEE